MLGPRRPPLSVLLALLLAACATGEPGVGGHHDARKPKSDRQPDWAPEWLDGAPQVPDLPAQIPDLRSPDTLARDSFVVPPDFKVPLDKPGCVDGHEPNNLCSAAASAGSVVEDAGWSSPKYGYLDTAGDVDWYSATGKEAGGTCIPLTSECLQFKVQVSVPAGRAFKLCLYKSNCNGSSTCTSNLAGQTTLTTQFKVDGTCAYNDDVDARIMVQPTDGKGSCDSYSIIFRYDSC